MKKKFSSNKGDFIGKGLTVGFIFVYAHIMALSATFGKNNKLNMFKLISYIQVKSLLADTLCTIFVYLYIRIYR